MKGERVIVIPLGTSAVVQFIVNGEDVNTFAAFQGKEINVEARKWGERRSLHANAYLHVLLQKIAEKVGAGFDEVKQQLVVDYGTQARNDDGTVVGVMLPDAVDARRFYPYVKWFADKYIGGKKFACYLVYKRSSEMDANEFRRLLDGVVQTAKDNGVETLSPDELNDLMSKYEKGSKEE